MAKASLVFSDKEDEDGTSYVSCSLELESALNKDEDPTPAQASALYCLRFMTARAAGPQELEEFFNELIEDGEWDGDTDD